MDTNVLMHAANSLEERCEDALGLVECLEGNGTYVCIDEGYSPDPSKNKSLIGDEYLRNLVPGSVGAALIAHLGRCQRLRLVPTKVPDHIRRVINRRVKNKRDRTFVRVAHNAATQILVSHDYCDFTVKTREGLRKDVHVQVVEASDAIALASP